MEKEKNPAFLFYYSNFQHAVRRWSLEETGEYILMICEQADSKTGGIDPEVFDAECTTPKVREKFEQDETGYYNPKLRGIIIKRNNFVETQRAKIAKRWNKDTPEDTGENSVVIPKDGKTIIEKEVEKEIEKPIEWPFKDEDFIRWWNVWKEYKTSEHRFTYKTTKSEQIALDKLKRESKNNSATACLIIEHSIGNGYKGLFPPSGNGSKEMERSNRPSRKKL